jgi:iron complex outermembrane recepter protein
MPALLFRQRTTRALLLLALSTSPPWVNAAPTDDSDDLLSLSLEELGSLQVTTLSRRPQPLSEAPASLYVITADAIHRSGVTSLPEALRLAPNLQVARIGSHGYAISARGFNNAISNKLQVLIDGRILQSPLFSGVFWDTPDVMLEDVERIEVITGPAATLWGANAVNGVINVISRRAEDTLGGLMSATAGNDERIGSVRYGARAGDAAYRVFARVVERDAMRRGDQTSLDDAWRRAEVGFRADWGTSLHGVTLRGNAYDGALDVPLSPDVRISGTDLLVAWNRELDSGDGLRVRGYADHSERRTPVAFSDTLDVYDVELRYVVSSMEGHALVLGGGHRLMRDRVDNAGDLVFLPEDRTLQRTNLFINDEIALGQRWRVTPGLRVEDNNYTGIEVMPSLRLAWVTPDGGLLWGAMSRAVRTPSRFDRELFVPGQAPFVLAGGPDFVSETSIASELGYRFHPDPESSWSVTLFHHDYDRLRSGELSASGAFVIGNRMQGQGVGLEAWGEHRIAERWRLSAGVLLLDQRLEFEPGSTDGVLRNAGNDPSNQWFVASALDLSEAVSVDLRVRHVGALPDPQVPAYTAFDVHAIWTLSRGVEVTFTGRNLGDPRHPEFGAPPTRGEVGRSTNIGFRWRF